MVARPVACRLIAEPIEFRFEFKGADPARYNVHLRGQGGYTDEKTGELVRWKKEPNGRRANMGAYGNTPWATSARPRQGLVVVVQ